MNRDLFNKTFEEVHKRSKVYLAVIVALVAVVVLQTIFISRSHERIVLVPPQIEKRMEVAWREGNREYFEAWAMQTAIMIGNVTPGNIKFVTDYLQKLFRADVYSVLKPQLVAVAERSDFKRGTSFTYFSPRAIRHEDRVNRFYVSGLIYAGAVNAGGNSSAGARIRPTPITYEFQFEMMGGLPVIIHFDSYEGLDPHDEKHRATQRKIEQQKAKKGIAKDDE